MRQVSTISVDMLADVTDRAISVIMESEGADEHGELLANLRSVLAACNEACGANDDLVFPLEGE